MAGVHDEHRKRLRERFAQSGLDAFNDINMLELLLCYSIPRKDTNEAAHRLLDRFGSISRVFEASTEELAQVPGIGRESAIFLSLIPQISRRYMIDKESRKTLITPEEAGKFLVPYFMYEKQEVVYVICLDLMKRVICIREIARGAVGSVRVDTRRIVELAINNGAASIIIAHNHVDSVAIPSVEDESVTRSLEKALRLLEIELIDHIIVAGSDFVSMAQSGIIPARDKE